MIKHSFYIEHEDGTVLEWTGMSFKKARDMLAYTHAHRPVGACRFGWYEEEHPVMGEELNLTNVRKGAEA